MKLLELEQLIQKAREAGIDNDATVHVEIQNDSEGASLTSRLFGLSYSVSMSPEDPPHSKVVLSTDIDTDEARQLAGER